MNDTPKRFLCPITHEVMREPLTSRYGQTYERKAILKWLQYHDNTCPLTRKKLDVSDFIRNRRLQMEIENWHISCGMSVDKESNPTSDKEADDDIDDHSIVLLTFTKESAIKFKNDSKAMKRHKRKSQTEKNSQADSSIVQVDDRVQERKATFRNIFRLRKCE